MSFFTELKRRKVFRVAATYLVVAWLIIQVGSITFPTLNLPSWALPLITVLIIIGFPFALILAWAYEITPEGIKPDSAAHTTQAVVQGSDPKLMYVLIALVLVVAGFQVTELFSSDTAGTFGAGATAPVAVATAPGETQRTSLVLPPDAPMGFGWTAGRSLAISPDGRTVAYTSLDFLNNSLDGNLAIRTLDSLQTRILPGTERGRQPFFSPDGQWLGFFTNDGALKKVPLNGGRAVTILNEINGSTWAFATWLDTNQIVFTDSAPPQVLKSISANGGQVSLLTGLNPAARETSHFNPEAIPGTDVVLFTSTTRIENQFQPNIEALRTGTGERQLVLQNASVIHYLDSGHLLFASTDQVRLIAPFDVERLMLTGPAVPMLDEVRHDGVSSEGLVSQLDVSRNGTLAFAPPVDTLRQLYLVARDGTAEALPVVPDSYEVISVAPNGQTAALEVRRGIRSEIRLYDFARQTSTLLAQEDRDDNFSPTWHPDSRSLVVGSVTSGEIGLWLKQPNGAARLLVAWEPGEPGFRNVSWHPDGRRLAVTRQTGSEHDILLLTLNGEDEPVTQEPLLVGSTNDHSPRFSPDGRWLAYVSQKTGQYQVYIRSFPAGTEYIVSTGTLAGGPLWSADGSELFFTQTAGTGVMMTAVSVTSTGDTLQLGQPASLFPIIQADGTGGLESYYSSNNTGARFVLMPDGRFLMSRAPSGGRQNEIVLVQNWFEELKSIVATP